MNLQDAQITGGKITDAHIDFYREYGYLVAKDLISREEIAELKRETVEIFRGKRGKLEGIVEVTDGETDEEVLKKYVAIHFPHKISPVIHRYLSHKGITGILTKIISPNVKCMQSMLFVKGPGKSGQAWHQDEYYIPTRDRSLTGAWIAIDDATVENGGLWIIPGSNREGYIRRREPNDNREYADVDTVNVSDYTPEKMIPVEVGSGTVVFFNGYTFHSSLKNKSTDNFRMALVNHYMSAESMLPWDQDGKLPPTEDLRDIVMVAGDDPYSYKGTLDMNKPYLRPDVLKIKTS
ncbi:phytanoyl-CoA dioxygenase family protein [Compostibacter hankyongensis]|uniref:Phytanoyl-CoA dioxygenase family protein n=1 Tax=Compostibacter hankyongensis TaxID=1007089 RepID=A0ABP8FL86_9BACT